MAHTRLSYMKSHVGTNAIGSDTSSLGGNLNLKKGAKKALKGAIDGALSTCLDLLTHPA